MKEQFDKKRLNQITPDELEAHGLIVKSAYGSKKAGHGYCCVYPNCNSGNGPNQSGALDFDEKGDHWEHICRSCSTGGDNIKLFQAIWQTDFVDACRRASEMFGIPITEGNGSYRPRRTYTPSNLPPSEKKITRYKIVDDPPDPKQLPLIQADIRQAQENLRRMPYNQRRGLTFDTYQYFGCGYLDKWIHPVNRVKNENLYPSRRIIIPTTDNEHYHAVALGADRPRLNPGYHKMHAGIKRECFNCQDLQKDIVVVSEGEIDMMSLFEAEYYSEGFYSHFTINNRDIGFVSPYGASNWKRVIVPYLDTPAIKDISRQFVIIFDNDDTGRQQAAEFQSALEERGRFVVVKFLVDYLDDDQRKKFPDKVAEDGSVTPAKVDANDLLIKLGREALSDIFDRLFTDAQAELQKKREYTKQMRLDISAPVKVNIDALMRHAISGSPAAGYASRLQEEFDSAPVAGAQSASQPTIESTVEVTAPVQAEPTPKISVPVQTEPTPEVSVPAQDIKSEQPEEMEVNKLPPCTPATPDPIDAKIEFWQSENGAIEPELITKLKINAGKIDRSENYAAIARDDNALKYLGAFRYYNFFAEVTDNYFSRLKVAKSRAQAKITGIKKLIESGTEIPDTSTPEEHALLEINITTTKNEVNKFKTAAKRAHRKYLEQKAVEDAAAQREADRAAYEKNPVTTRQAVITCPVDIDLPEGVIFDNSGIHVTDFEKPPTKFGYLVLDACQNIVVPVKGFSPFTERGKPRTTPNQYEIAIYTGSRWSYTIVDAQTLEDTRKVTELANHGVHVTNARALAQYFAKIIAMNEKNGKLKVVRVYTQPGWHDGEFIYPTNEPDADYIVRNGGFDYAACFTPKGDKKAWLKMLKRVLWHDPDHYTAETVIDATTGVVSAPDNLSRNISAKINYNAAFAFGFACGAPLIEPLGLRNQQMTFAFDSGNGKTAAAKFATSLFGSPDNGMYASFNATANYLEDLAIKLNGFPHGVDEFQIAGANRYAIADTLIYKFSVGACRGRADIKGNARPTPNYHGCRLFTGEENIIALNSNAGAIARVFEIRYSKLFADPFAVEVHNFVRENYGLFGKAYTTEYIPAHLEQIKEFYAKILSFYTKSFVGTETDLLASHAATLAYAATGLYATLNFLNYDKAEEVVWDYIIESAEIFLLDTPTKAMTKNVNRVLPDLREFFDAHPKNFIREVIQTPGASPDYLNADATETYGVRLADGRYAVYPSVLRRIIKDDLGYNGVSNIIMAFGENGYIDGNKTKTRPYQIRIGEEFGEQMGKMPYFYVFTPHDDAPTHC